MKKRKKLKVILIAAVVVFTGMQFIRPDIPAKPVTGDLDAPPEVEAIFRKACYDCHSNETNLRWYDEISPINWLVAEDIKAGREGLNFSEWDKLAPGDRKAKLWESVNQVGLGAMPLKNYTMVHPGSRVSAGDLAVLKNYLLGTIKDKPSDTALIQALEQQQANRHLQTGAGKLPVTINGIAYIPDYKNWQAISTTDRIDNGTMRVIFGNDIAVKAIASGQVNPWPNGTILAKVAWDQLQDKDGNVRTGAFKQIEYMIKDKQRFKDSYGWGFARFKTPELVPYGKTVQFVTECVNCHRPVADKDFVFTSPLNN